MLEIVSPKRRRGARRQAFAARRLARWASRYIRHPVARNALALYALQFGGYVLPLVTIPYLARTLHPEGFGLLLFFQSFALWSSMIIEYGFNLSATREVARSSGEANALAEICANVFGAKATLSLVFVVVASLLGSTQTTFHQHPNYVLWAIPLTLALGLSPFWYFQGMERMVRAVRVEFVSRAMATLSIFLFVHSSEDAWKALAVYAVAGTASTGVQTLWMYREIGFRLPHRSGSIAALKKGWNMFLFRGAYNVYSSSNTFILGLLVPPLQVGFYGGAEKIFKAFQGLSLPISQSLYPRMAHLASEDLFQTARLARFALTLATGIGLTCAIVVACVARRAVALILGPGYQAATSVLYVFAMALPVNSINGVLIMQWMLPLGMERAVGAITMGAIVVNVAAASFLATRYAHSGMAFSVLFAEMFTLAAISSILLRLRRTPFRDIS